MFSDGFVRIFIVRGSRFEVQGSMLGHLFDVGRWLFPCSQAASLAGASPDTPRSTSYRG
jgi:hypothetical protein